MVLISEGGAGLRRNLVPTPTPPGEKLIWTRVTRRSFDALPLALLAWLPPPVPEGRDWQTRRDQNPEVGNQRAGLTPPPGTITATSSGAHPLAPAPSARAIVA